MQRSVMQQDWTGETLVAFLEGAAQRHTSRTALLFKPGFRYHRWSYSDLWEGAGQVATLLQQWGLVKGDRVLIWGPNCPQWVLAFFGCMRAGAVAVPLDLRSPTEFAETVASKTRPKLAFVSRLTPPSHEELGLAEVRFEELEGLVRELPDPEHVDIAPEDLAEIIFTSGTTGDPKGVMLTHGNLTSNIEAAVQYIPGLPSDRLLSILPLSHMFEQLGGLFIALRIGADITYPTSRQPTVLSRTMRERKVTMLLLVPQGLELLMNSIEREVSRQGKERLWHAMLSIARRTPFRLRRRLFRRVHKQFGGSLGLVVSAGAALDPELGEKWELLGVRITQGYGATEASPVISIHTMDKPRYDSVGPPLPGVEVRIADDGEVFVRGPNITPGYWEAPEQTESAFLDGWYRTGDQGFIDADGNLHLQGRKKDMIVLSSGQNVYPEDIEAVLKKHPEVTDSAVVGVPKGSGVEVHAALLIDDADNASQAVSWANERLAEHQQIRGFTVWPEEDLPRTHTLKVKKRLVLDVLQSISEGEDSKPAASDGAQTGGARGVEDLVADVTGFPLAQIRPEMTVGNDLNLDSLGRVELLSAIEEELGVYLDESEVGPETTIGELVGRVESGSSSAQATSFPSWGMSWWCRPLRGTLQRAFIFPLLRLTYGLRVTGQENLQDIRGPILFAANHNLPLDNGLIVKAIPSQWRRRLAIAAAAKLWRSPLWAYMNPLLGNGFPFSQEGGIRASMDNLGQILDKGWTVLIYPEGKVTVGGPTAFLERHRPSDGGGEASCGPTASSHS